MTALIIIDLQNDFMPWGSLSVSGADHIIKPIISLIPKFQHVLATQDWHPPDHVSFALNHGKRVGEVIEVGGVKQILWPEHCVQESLGAALVAPLASSKIEKIFFKGTDTMIDSYSAFFDNAKKKSTGLDAYLKKKGIHTLYFAGVATDYCVKFSVIDACSLGFKCFVIKDACKAVNIKPDDEEKAVKEMEYKGAHIILTDHLELKED